MADAQQHLDDHYGPMGLVLVDEPKDTGKGLSSKDAVAFLKRTRPVTRTGQTLGEAAKKAKPAA